jgi:hypothetical protein
MSPSSSRRPTPGRPRTANPIALHRRRSPSWLTREKVPQRGPDDARIIEEHRITGRHDEGETDASDCGGRRWYDLRPSLAAAATSWDSTPHSGWRWCGSS